MVSVVSFPVVGRYQEGAEMGYLVEDEEHDALEFCPLEAFPLYMNLRKRMDFATGIVGGPKRRISWGELATWMSRESKRGRKAVTASISKARRVVGQMVQHGLLEYRTDREHDYLMFFLPLAKSDVTEAKKRSMPEYQEEIAAAIAETANCVSLRGFRKREATTGDYVQETVGLLDAQDLPTRSDTVHLYSTEGRQNYAESRQTFDRGDVPEVDNSSYSVTDCSCGGNQDAQQQSRQGSDSEAIPNSDNNNPFTPNTSNKIYINTNSAQARVCEDFSSKPKIPQVQRAVQSALRQATKTPGAAGTPPGCTGFVRGLETLGYDHGSGFSLQISDGVRRRNPQLAKALEAIAGQLLDTEDRA